MPKCILRFVALLCLAGLFTSCMFFPKADPSKRFAGISAVKTDSAEDILNDMEIEDDEIFAVKVSQEASVTATTEANLFGVYPTYILVKVRPADAKTASVSIYRRRNADYDPELIVDHVSAGQSVFEDYIESARAFETYEYKTIVTLKNGTDISSEWLTGYGALTPERLFFVMNDEVGSSHKKFPDFGKAKVTTNNASGYRNGSARYEVQIKGLGGTAYITYDNYCDYRLNISGSCNTDSDMSGNGNMWGTLVVSGMYHGSCNYDSITVRSKNAAAGTYLVTTAGVQKRLIYNISDTAPSKSNLITLTASTNTEPQEGEVPNILGVYPITLTWNVDEDFQTGSTLKILRRTMEENTGRVIYDAPVENGSVFADLFDGDMQQPQTFYQYQAQLYKGGSLQDKTRWESGIGYLPPITMTVTASQGTSPEGSEPNEFGIFPISVTYDVPLESSLLDNATYTLVRRLKDSDETRTVLYTGSEHSGSLTDVNNEAMFGQEFEYCIEITNADGQLIRRSEWVTGYGDRLPLGMELTVSDNADNLDNLTPNRYGAYPVTLQYALVSVDDSLTDLTYTLRRRNEETGVEEMLMTEAVEGSQGVFTDTTADARRVLNRSWAYAVELHAGDILMYRTDWITVEPVLVPATLTLTASDNKENMDIAADRFGVTPVTLTWNWESDAEFLEDSCYVKVYYKPADDLTGTAIPDAPAGLEGQYTMSPDTAAYQYKADLVYPNGKKTSVIATTDWTEAVDPYIISFGFDPITVSNNDGNLTLEPNQYGVNPFTISWNWNCEKPFLQEGSYFTLTRRSADNVETVLLNKEAGCRDPQLVYTDLISDAKRSGNRMFTWKADLYTAQDELLSTTGWSAAATSWIVPVDCSMT
ncbi:MAG: hypothetical protein MJ178_07335, partial [Treponemataceae bacterium]|nr:hypothetical protein [Treponemataceae bacterium]